MRAQSLQCVCRKYHVTVKQEHESAVGIIQPVVKVHLARFVPFCRSYWIRKQVAFFEFDICNTVSANAYLKFIADHADITRAFVFQNVLLSSLSAVIKGRALIPAPVVLGIRVSSCIRADIARADLDTSRVTGHFQV